jgi:hypothetical protein
MQITDKDIQTFRERAKTELQSNGAVGRLAWDAVVNALCNEVEELRKNAAISKAVDSAWVDVCAACAKGIPPTCCAYYGDPSGCNAPTLGKHPEGDLAERLQEALENAARRISELERAPGNAAAMRKALKRVEDELTTMNPRGWGDTLTAVRSALAAPSRNCDRSFRSVNEAIGAYVGERGDGPHLGYCDAIKWALAPEKGGAE